MWDPLSNPSQLIRLAVNSLSTALSRLCGEGLSVSVDVGKVHRAHSARVLAALEILALKQPFWI